MPYYEGQTGSTTRRPQGGGRQSDLLMQQLGTSSSEASKSTGDADDFASLGFDGNSTTSSAPLTFDSSTDTRVGNPRKRRGNGKHLGTVSGQSRQERPQAAGMIRNDEEIARRQQIIQGVADDDMSVPRQRASYDANGMPAVTPSRPVMPASAPRQQMGPVTGIRLNTPTATDADEESPFKNNPLTARIRELRGRRFINPITFIQENGGGIETFGIWLYEYRHLFIVLTIIFLIVGMLFDRRISFGAGIVMILVSMWMDRIDDDNDTFLVYLCGFVTALVPFLISA